MHMSLNHKRQLTDTKGMLLLIGDDKFTNQ